MVKPKPKRNKALTILLLPVLACLFVIGFCLYVIGDRKNNSEKQLKPLEKNSVSIISILHEEQEEEIYA